MNTTVCVICKTTDPDNHNLTFDLQPCPQAPTTTSYPCDYCGSTTGPRVVAHDHTGRHNACHDCYDKHHDPCYKPNSCPSCGGGQGGGNCLLCGSPSVR